MRVPALFGIAGIRESRVKSTILREFRWTLKRVPALVQCAKRARPDFNRELAQIRSRCPLWTDSRKFPKRVSNRRKLENFMRIRSGLTCFGRNAEFAKRVLNPRFFTNFFTRLLSGVPLRPRLRKFVEKSHYNPKLRHFRRKTSGIQNVQK